MNAELDGLEYRVAPFANYNITPRTNQKDMVRTKWGSRDYTMMVFQTSL